MAFLSCFSGTWGKEGKGEKATSLTSSTSPLGIRRRSFARYCARRMKSNAKSLPNIASTCLRIKIKEPCLLKLQHRRAGTKRRGGKSRLPHHALVAQWTEQDPSVVEVGGSTPSEDTGVRFIRRTQCLWARDRVARQTMFE